jgi:hypothetical protein
MNNDSNEPIVDVDGSLLEEYKDYVVVPNPHNEFLRFRVLKETSPAFNYVIEVNSVETDIIEDHLSMRLGFEIIDEHTEERITAVYDALSDEDKGMFVKDMGDVFSAVILKGLKHIQLDNEDDNVSK